MTKSIKITLWTFIVLLGLTFLFFLFLEFYSYYIGYRGYDKQKDRRFSDSVVESQQRGVFIKNLYYHVDSIQMNAIFMERAYKWGEWSSQRTVLLAETDTFNKYSDYPYQIIIVFDKVQNSNLIAIPVDKIRLKETNFRLDVRNNVLSKDTNFSDTIYYNVFIRDSLHNLKSTDVLKYGSKLKIKHVR